MFINYFKFKRMGNNLSPISICCKRCTNEPEIRNKAYIKSFSKEKLKILLIQSIWRGFKKRNQITKSRSNNLKCNYASNEAVTPQLNWKVMNIINSLPPIINDKLEYNKNLKKIGPVQMENDQILLIFVDFV